MRQGSEGTLATFRLYVGHQRTLSSHEHEELRHLLWHGRDVSSFFTKPSWRNAFVSFCSTEEAIATKEVSWFFLLFGFFEVDIN